MANTKPIGVAYRDQLIDGDPFTALDRMGLQPVGPTE